MDPARQRQVGQGDCFCQHPSSGHCSLVSSWEAVPALHTGLQLSSALAPTFGSAAELTCGVLVAPSCFSSSTSELPSVWAQKPGITYRCHSQGFSGSKSFSHHDTELCKKKRKNGVVTWCALPTLHCGGISVHGLSCLSRAEAAAFTWFKCPSGYKTPAKNWLHMNQCPGARDQPGWITRALTRQQSPPSQQWPHDAQMCQHQRNRSELLHTETCL